MPDKSLIELVFELAAEDDTLTEEAKRIITDALAEGEGSAGEQRPRPAGPVHLTSIGVTGFRGIGPRSVLRLDPGPGLTVVTGRNGAGKSSFAEALEFALTGDSYRWLGKRPTWTECWRNLHWSGPTAIRIGAVVGGDGDTELAVDWADDADRTDFQTWHQRPGLPRKSGLADLGWGEALEHYRPILSYEELGGLLRAEPSKLYDALNPILGIGQVTAVRATLNAELKQVQAPVTRAKEAQKALKAALAGLDDSRARAALAELGKRAPDLGALAAQATGTADRGPLDVVRALAGLVVPDPEVVAQVVRALREAVREHVGESGDERRAELLRQALELHAEHGDRDCPVCGAGRLDRGWRDRVEAELTGLDEERLRLHAARFALTAAVQRARELVRIAPLATPDGIPLGALAPAQEVAKRWRDAPDDAAALVDHLEQVHPELVAACAALRAEAAQTLEEMDSAWTPLAARLAEWVVLRAEADGVEDRVTALKAATKWLKDNEQALRAERLRPYADRAKEVWEALRQASDVDLEEITLEGAATRRHVELRAQLGGAPATALSVMSQGELHALALALFIPRATDGRSPFRFLVLDDPVQAMDPAKVDGFARLLAEVAQDRQVVVFSHDDRLPEVVRDLNLPGAKIVEITRGAGSRITVGTSLDQADRYVSDADALVKDPGVTDDLKARVLPLLCRLAVEAVAKRVLYARRLAAGVDRPAAEVEWEAEHGTRARVLLVHEERWINQGNRPHRARTMRVCGRDVHQGTTRELPGVVTDLRKTLADLRETR
ncbi:ATP-binding protein [Actinosynnema pretiosum]|uniref:Nuclease SbcCD subunit C n=1 Tax=Actinosynnema pretiosum TaxID=42197 RepID=A0A290ZDL0_9PSEU|nr:ATP-binding protein [Actinosynnema pretiosum]ATE57062.1 recombinase RecF [Actinosynnema pretiosum]